MFFIFKYYWRNSRYKRARWPPADNTTAARAETRDSSGGGGSGLSATPLPHLHPLPPRSFTPAVAAARSAVRTAHGQPPIICLLAIFGFDAHLAAAALQARRRPSTFLGFPRRYLPPRSIPNHRMPSPRAPFGSARDVKTFGRTVNLTRTVQHACVCNCDAAHSGMRARFWNGLPVKIKIYS